MSVETSSSTSSPPTGSENQWAQEPVNNRQQYATPLQWREMPLPDMVPVPVVNELSTSIYSPTLNHQKQFFQPNNANNMNNYNTQNIIDTQFGSQLNSNGLYLPNGMRAVSGNAINRTPSSISNGVVTNTIGNGWVIPGQNQARLLTRPGWSPAAKTTGVRKPKRIRTAFTSQQMMELEQEYARARYLDRTRRIELAETLHLNERTIKIWFQNRRMKEKKDKAESLEEEGEATSTTDSSSEYMPIVMQDELTGEVYSRNIYVEEYPATSTAMQTSVPMSQTEHSPMINGYAPAFTSEYNQVDQSRQQVHLQMQSYPPPPPYSSELQAIEEDSAPSLVEVTPAPSANAMVDQNWDYSWIRSIHISDDC